MKTTYININTNISLVFTTYGSLSEIVIVNIFQRNLHTIIVHYLIFFFSSYEIKFDTEEIYYISKRTKFQTFYSDETCLFSIQILLNFQLDLSPVSDISPL